MATNKEVEAQFIKDIEIIQAALTIISVKYHPYVFKKFFLAVTGNLVGNMTEGYWEEFKECHPCEIPGCDCHIVLKHSTDCLEVTRKDYQECVNERGFSE